MPPRKKQLAPASKGKQPSKLRRSKLAQENDISAEDEDDIKMAFRMFRKLNIPGFEDEKEGVIRVQDVRNAFKAQGIPLANAHELAEFIEILDPESKGYGTYKTFVELSALKLAQRTDESKLEEVEEAYKLFTRGGDGPINIYHLRRVAKDIREDVNDGMLKEMILFANGRAGVNQGVGIEDFRAVMTDAGVFK